MKGGKWEMYVLREEIGQRMRIIIEKVKVKVGLIFRVKQTLGSDYFYLGLRPTVDIALIPLCHTRFSEENQVLNYMYARIKFHTYSDIIVYNRNNIT
jgi:hypothetical protein